ncbi:hypothetical protein CAL26_09980 [Bordetella genomosp. 9]|uniref:Uncharacterized protein n=1 Tax=Bordetella genomosp. 9 TaxID=1416803 RepID=A0A261RFE7_9BORD|nr:hypothetical protein [Bordetella genomosp. 9]OZI23749.1 hypothetical protein CAL26_09980 [Bordetella genomosp. 9]
MASVIDIGNLALGHLGEAAEVSSINPPEGSAYADHIARFYPVARDVALQDQGFPWSFAVRRVYLAVVMAPGDDGNPYVGRYAYAMPADCLQPTAVLTPGADDANGDYFDTEVAANGSKLIICDTPSAILKYTRVVDDPTKFTPLFLDALAWLLASYLAGPIIKGDAGATKARECLGVYQSQIANARVADMRGRKVDTGYKDHRPDWIAARGGY